MTATRSDLAFSVSNCARYMSNSSQDHFKALNRVWQYVRTTAHSDLLYNNSSRPELTDYVDSDWGGDYSTRKSITDYLFMFEKTSVSWSSRLQKSVALSSCEAEYMTLKEAVKELIWFKTVCSQVRPLNEYSSMRLFSDSKSAIDLARNSEFHYKTKHIDIRYHFVRDELNKRIFQLEYVCTKDQLADALTKTLNSSNFRRFLMNVNITNQSSRNTRCRTEADLQS
jgi:hypothetical protein